MMDIPEKANLRCLFCGSEKFETDTDKEPKVGDMLKCAACGKLNSHEGMFEVCKEEVVEDVKKAVTKELRDTLKKAFKGSKHIRIK